VRHTIVQMSLFQSGCLRRSISYISAFEARVNLAPCETKTLTSLPAFTVLNLIWTNSRVPRNLIRQVAGYIATLPR
jgi:hypothetical protein